MGVSEFCITGQAEAAEAYAHLASAAIAGLDRSCQLPSGEKGRAYLHRSLIAAGLRGHGPPRFAGGENSSFDQFLETEHSLPWFN